MRWLHTAQVGPPHDYRSPPAESASKPVEGIVRITENVTADFYGPGDAEAPAAAAGDQAGTGALRASQRPLSSLLCTYQSKWVARLGNDGQRLKEFAQWPTRSGQEVTMDLKDRRLWYGVVAAIVVLVAIAYAAGWFGGTPLPAPQQ